MRSWTCAERAAASTLEKNWPMDAPGGCFLDHAGVQQLHVLENEADVAIKLAGSDLPEIDAAECDAPRASGPRSEGSIWRPWSCLTPSGRQAPLLCPVPG